MSALVPGNYLPVVYPPFSMELVRVLDPRIEGRTMAMYLMTKEIRVLDEKKMRSTREVSYKMQRIVCSPMVSYNDPNAICEIMSFTVIDPRFASSTVQVCFTMQEAMAFRQSIASTNVAREIVASGDELMRLQCYMPNCTINSSKLEKIHFHFLTDHSKVQFEPQRVKVYQFGGPQDPSVIRSSSARYNTLPPSSSAPVTAVLASQNTSLAGELKRRRGAGVADLHIPNKAARKETTAGSTASANRSTTARATPAIPVVSSFGNVTGGKGKALVGMPAYAKDLLCICFKPEDGRPIIECDNGAKCFLRWYHIDCVGLSKDDLPSADVPWYCPRCCEQGIGGALTARSPAAVPRDILQSKRVRMQTKESLVDNDVGKGKAPKYPGGLGRDADVPKPSPSVNLNPWSADLAKAFVEDPDNIRDFGLGSLEEARATLLALSKVPIGRAKSPPDDGAIASEGRWGRPLTAAGTLKTPNSRSWTDEEEQHLKEVIEECVAEGLAGEPLWKAAHPKLVARGVNRPVGGMKMRWCRGLRQQTKIDERRKKNENKLITALQGPKVNKDPGAPKKGRFKGKGMHGHDASATASSPIRKSTGDITPSDLRTAPLRKMPMFSSFNSAFDVDMRNLREASPDSLASDDSDMSDLDHDIRRRARSV